MVEIEGAVLNPSVIQWTNKFSWKDYINSGGGGPLDTADIKRTYIIYPNGVTVKAKTGWMSSSTIHPGSKIIVPYKPFKPPAPPKEPFNYNALLATVSASLGIILVAITISDKVGN